jgi:hypothetical protein
LLAVRQLVIEATAVGLVRIDLDVEVDPLASDERPRLKRRDP